jgi:hypothetical protein
VLATGIGFAASKALSFACRNRVEKLGQFVNQPSFFFFDPLAPKCRAVGAGVSFGATLGQVSLCGREKTVEAGDDVIKGMHLMIKLFVKAISSVIEER